MIKFHHPSTPIINNKKLIKHAINKTCERRLEYLLEAGLDPNSTTIMDDDYVDEIPLLFYIIRHKCGFKSYFFDWSIETLLRYGANFKFKDFEGDTMLHFIIGDKKLRYLIPLFIKYGARCDIPNDAGITPLMKMRKLKLNYK